MTEPTQEQPDSVDTQEQPPSADSPQPTEPGPQPQDAPPGVRYENADKDTTPAEPQNVAPEGVQAGGNASGVEQPDEGIRDYSQQDQSEPQPTEGNDQAQQ